MDFSVIDTNRAVEYANNNNEFTNKVDEYTKKAKEQWGNTKAYKEYEKKSACRTKEENALIGNEFMGIFTEFGKIKNEEPSSKTAQAMV